LSIVIRPGQREDRPFLFSTFVNGYERSHYAHGASARTLAALFGTVLSHPDWALAVACPPDDDGAIVGWILYRPETSDRAPALAWLHVRGAYRRRGVGKALLAHAGARVGATQQVACTFLTPDAAKMAARHGLVLRFRPYIAVEAATIEDGAAKQSA